MFIKRDVKRVTSHARSSPSLCNNGRGLGTRLEIQYYFLGRDGEGSKWPPVHKVQEQLPKNEPKELKKLTDYFALVF